jgi:GNAT superfamily N-acetyltransferase
LFVLRHDLRPGDLGQILALHGTLCARDHAFDPLLEAGIAASLAEFVHSRSEGDRMWIAESDGRIAGCIALVGLSPKDAHFRWFIVDPSAGGLGLERRLLDAAIEFGERRGYEYLYLWTIRAPETTQHYQSLDFEKVQERWSTRGGLPVLEDQYVLHRPSRRC